MSEFESVKIYACCIGASAWGNGGDTFYYTDKESRDLKLKNAPIEDCPRGWEDDAFLIGGILYWPPVKVKLTMELGDYKQKMAEIAKISQELGLMGD